MTSLFFVCFLKLLRWSWHSTGQRNWVYLLTTDWAQWSPFSKQKNSNPLEAFTKAAGIRPLIKFPEPRRNEAASDTPAFLILFMLEDKVAQTAER